MQDALFLDVCRNGYLAVFQMIGEAVHNCPVEAWDDRAVEAPFWQQAYHTLWGLDFYLGEDPSTTTCPTAIDFDSRALAYREGPAPGKEEILDYLAAVREKGLAFAAKLTAEQLESENPFGWTGPTVAHRLFYNIRHAQHHLGQMNSILARHGADSAEWVVYVSD